MSTVGEALIGHLVEHGVEVIFGIPGVHTIELYRGLEKSGILHVTPRHEQGAGFMADGYARATGKPGVALVISGPGVTNILTPMAQARADSIPMLVISSVNALPTLGRELGHLHELPDQLSTIGSVAVRSLRIESENDLGPAIQETFAGFEETRPGPAHIEIPLDVAKFECKSVATPNEKSKKPMASQEDMENAFALLSSARAPVIIAGGGMRRYNTVLERLAQLLDAPTILTINARGLMHNHELTVPASPSLNAVRNLIAQADVVLAVGTEIGQTDFDMYATGSMPDMQNVIRVDICNDQLERYDAALKIHSEAGEFCQSLNEKLVGHGNERAGGTERAAHARSSAYEEIGEDMRSISALLTTIRDTVPNAIIVGDSTQPVYAGNLYYDHDRPGGWFNAATGYGALGYGIPSSIGAAIGAPGIPVICLCGDGGAQFSLPEFMTAVDGSLQIIFVIWNNHGYGEIETSMRSAGVELIGCDPTPPDFALVAASCGMRYFRSDVDPDNVALALKKAQDEETAVLLEIDASAGLQIRQE